MGRGTVVGRERERAVLAGALDDALTGRGGVVLLTGEGGMGKTTLAEELAASASARGAQVVRGHGWEGQNSPALVVWREVLDELGEPPGQVQVTRVDQVLRAATVHAPLLVLLEDLHAADADSARAVAHLSSRLGSTRVLVVATLREQELRDRPGAAEALDAVSAQCRRVAVPPLTVDGVAELASALLGRPAPDHLLGDLTARSDGNAFYVRELVESSMATGVPQGVAASVRRRLAALPVDVVLALHVSACAGREVDVRAVAAAAGRPVEQGLELLGSAVAAGVLEDKGRGRLRFRHALVAEVLRADLLPGERAVHHLALAAAARAATPLHAVTVAYHLLEAGPLADADETSAWCVRAADEAESAGAPLEAVRHLRLAAERTTDPLQHARLHERIGQCLFDAGAYTTDAVHAFEIALAGYERAGQTRRSGIVHSRLGSHLSLYRRTADFGRAERHFATALGLLTAPVDRAHVLVGTSTLALLRGLPHDALVDGARAEQIATAASRSALAATGRLMTGAGLLAVGRLREGFQALDASFSAGQVLRPTVDVQTAYHGIGTAVVLEDPALALSYAERGQRALEGVDLPGQAQIISDLLSPAYALRGDLARARSTLAPEDLLGFQVQREGLIPAYAGDWEALVPHLEDMLGRDAADGHAVRVAALCWVLGWVLRLQGDLDRARPHLERGLAEALRDDRVLDAVRLRLELALLAAAADDRVSAAVHVEACAQVGAREDLRGLAVRLMLARAVLRGGGFEQVVAAADRRHLPFLALDALARWRDAVPARAAGIGQAIVARLDALGVRGTGWEALVPLPAQRPADEPLRVLRDEGETWAIEGGVRVVRVRDGKGLRHLARLLGSPGREWHCLELAGLAEGQAGTPPSGLAQPVIDGQARRAYRSRLALLEQEMDDAALAGDAVRGTRARLEHEAVLAHLSAALGLGGHPRGMSDPAERARQSVTKTLRAAVERITEQDPLTGEHLRLSLRTGAFCCYAPDPATSLRWQVVQPTSYGVR